MELGRIGVFVGLAGALCTIPLYLLSLRGNKTVLRLARLCLGLTAFSALFCFFRLMWLVTHKQFQYDYVFSYVSPDLHYPFLAAATWAGQEGSFLLWASWTGIIGCLIAWKAGKWEARVMPVFVTALAFLFGILIWQSPYNMLARGGANGYPLDLPWPPNFGMGLYPSLQNVWMAIHPPTIFFGFASLLVPFSYAIAALIWHEYETWAPRVMPYVLMTVATLGVGLFMGGYWAYETQGWHGFWGWDPVENASLFPWLGCLGLLHGLVVQKNRGGMGRTNVFLAILSWTLFLYGTFLTRSGVLAEASVHSFDMIKKGALSLILVMIGAYGLGGLALLVARWNRIPGRPISDKALSRDTALVLAVTLMIIACTVVCLGASWPLISKWSIFRWMMFVPTNEKGAVQTPFYNQIGSFLLIPTLFLMGVVPFLAWGKTNLDKFLWKVLAPWFISIGVGVCVLWYVWVQSGIPRPPDEPIGTPSMLVVGIATLGAFAAAANCILAWKVLRAKAVTMGGWLAHVGIGILFLGTVITNVYERTEGQYLIEGDKPWKTPFGYSLQWAGWSHDDKLKLIEQTTDPQAHAKLEEELHTVDWYQHNHGIKIRVIPARSEVGVAHADSGEDEFSKSGFLVTLPVFNSHVMEMNPDSQQKTFKWPYIHQEMFRDIYMLVGDEPKLERIKVKLGPGESSKIPMTAYSITYKKFFMDGGPGQPNTVMGAEMDLITPQGKTIPFRTGMQITDQGPKAIPTQIPEVQGAAVLEGGLDPATKQATVAFEFPEAPALWKVAVVVTNKPMINLVWLGVILMGMGTLCAMVRRSMEARKGALMLTAVAAGAGDIPVSIPEVASNGANGKNGAHSRHKPPKGGKAKISTK